MRKTQFAKHEFYHIFNRGVDKREFFLDFDDFSRFFQSINQFNTIKPIGSIYENSFKDLSIQTPKSEKLVNFVCYCINPNHYHFLLEQLVNNGIEKFMHRVGTGYTKYFNNKYQRTGSLFQGSFKSKHITSNEYLLHISAYINLNANVHQLGSLASKFKKSSWEEYIGKRNFNFCEKGVILEQFNNVAEYKDFAEESLKDIRKRKEMEKLLLE